MAKRLKKNQIKVTIGPNKDMVIYSEKGVVPWSEYISKWKEAAGKSLPDGSGSPTVLSWIENMGKIGRKKGRAEKGKENFKAKAPIPRYLQLADAIGTEKNLSDEQFSAVTKLKEYLESNDNENSKINPQNISFRSVVDFEEDEEGNGFPTSFRTVYGDYRTPQYREFRNEYKGGGVEVIPDDWYDENPREANPPVYQALWGTLGTPWFDSKSLLQICKEYEEQELEELPFKPTRENPLKVGGNGTAEFLMNNVPGFRKFVLETVQNTSQYRLPNGNYRSKRAMNMLRKNPTAFPLTDDQSDKVMQHLKTERLYDLSGIFLDVNWRQMAHAAKMLPDYKRLNYGVSDSEVEKKSKVSEDGVKKSQEKSPVSLSWKEVMKVRT